jgi:Flp pilus assembly protein TadG
VRWRNRADAGALTLSYVIIFPAILFTIMAIAQASLYYMAHNLALAAARQGADVAREYNSTDAEGHSAAMALINNDGSGMLQGPSAAVTRTGTTVTVTVRGTAWSVLPILPFPILPVAVSETVKEPIERFVP